MGSDAAAYVTPRGARPGAACIRLARDACLECRFLGPAQAAAPGMGVCILRSVPCACHPVIAKSAPKLEKGGSGVAGLRPAPLRGVEHPQGPGAR